MEQPSRAPGAYFSCRPFSTNLHLSGYITNRGFRNGAPFSEMEQISSAHQILSLPAVTVLRFCICLVAYHNMVSVPLHDALGNTNPAMHQVHSLPVVCSFLFLSVCNTVSPSLSCPSVSCGTHQIRVRLHAMESSSYLRLCVVSDACDIRMIVV